MNNSTKPTVLTASDIMQPVLQAFPKAKTWWVACSGGVDSMLLAKLAVDFCNAQMAEMPIIKLLHINHQLQASSDQWQQQCESFAKTLGVTIVCEKVEVNSQGKGIESAAREARYQVFDRYVKTDDVLLMGHHLNDQAETFFLRVLRGAGLKGLRAIPQQRALTSGMLFRPLLTCSRASIELTTKHFQLNWVEDPSNQHDHYDRNYLRLHILPLLQQRWPQALKKIHQLAYQAKDDQKLLNDLAQLDINTESLLANNGALCLEPLTALSELRQNNVLRYWLESQGLELPSQAFMSQLRKQFLLSADDAQPILSIDNGELRRYQNKLYYYSKQDKLAQQFEWLLKEDLQISSRSFLSAELINMSSTSKGLKKIDCVTVRFRQGGEKIKPYYLQKGYGSDKTRELKKIFQELEIPVWLRDEIPLLYSGDDLVAVGDQLIAVSWLANETEPAWKINWKYQ